MHLILMTSVQQAAPVWREGEKAAAVIGLGTGAAVAFLVYRFARRVPWPKPFRPRFAALHLVAAPVAALAWYALSVTLESLVPGYVPDVQGGSRVEMHLIVGTIFYAIIAGVAHAVEGSARAARAEAMAARTQLAAL
ncbi:hypothetical protein, partial [Longimicrobium sp.]|uniref:hypothetical protein n=1 Tax=Longimicrobium sp. TaxID=2029185 RepID=UPI002F952AAA